MVNEDFGEQERTARPVLVEKALPPQAAKAINKKPIWAQSTKNLAIICASLSKKS